MADNSPRWSDADEHQFTELMDRRGFTTVELAQWLAVRPDVDQGHVLSVLSRANPELVTRMLFPAEDDATRRNGSFYELKRLMDQDRARELFDQLKRGATSRPEPRSLGRVVERLEVGLETRPEPTVGGLLYPSRVNAVYGTHTAGKTWLALYLARLNAEAGGVTLVIDYEDSAVGIADRCRAMDPKLAGSVRYYAPDGRLDAAALGDFIADEGVTLVILDSVGESLAMGGYDSNAERDVTQWFTEVPDALAALGPAVLIIDHIAKRQDGTPSPVGSFRKSAAITGAMFALENKVGFSRQKAGWSKLTCTKDRNGYFATGEVVGRVSFEPGVDSMEVRLDRGATEAEAFSAIEQAVRNYVGERMVNVHGKLDDEGEEMDGRPSITQIRGAVSGGNTKVKAAVDALVERGYLAVEHLKQGKSTRDVYVPAEPLGAVDEDDDDLL